MELNWLRDNFGIDDIMLIRLKWTILVRSPFLKMGYRIKRYFYKSGNISEDSDKEKINFNNIVLKV